MDEPPNIHSFQHGEGAADVVRIRVCQHECAEVMNAEALQMRDHGSHALIRVWGADACVHE